MDYHTQIDHRSVWECYHTHNPGGEHLAYLLPQLYTYWSPFWEVEGVPLPTSDTIQHAHHDVTSSPQRGVAAWRFPPHSLATNTFRLLLSIFHTAAIFIEGFGAGTSFAATAGLLALSLCLGAVAMHPPTFCSLIRAFYERDLRAHKDFLEEKRPDKKTRPANYKAKHSAKEPQHGFLIVQHLHDRRSPWSLSPIILSPLQQGDLGPHSP